MKHKLYLFLNICFLSFIPFSLGCKSNADCTNIDASVCSKGNCVECQASADCTHIKGRSCFQLKSGNKCSISCKTSDNSCKASQSYCFDYFKYGEYCTVCSRDSDCKGLYGASAKCLTIASLNYCTECLTTSDCTGGKVCKNYACVTCSSDSDCLSTSPVCNPYGLCTSCSSDADCLYFSNLPVCKNDGSCVECTLDNHCPQKLPACSSQNKCGPCTSSSQCGVNKVCSRGSCVQCATTSDCSAPNVCLSGNICGLCTLDSDCAGSGDNKFCYLGTCVNCRSNGDCSIDKYCQASNMTCTMKECDIQNGIACPYTKPICLSNYSCNGCTKNTDCTSIYPICLSNGTCGQCNSNNNCTDINPICSNNICRPCLAGSECNTTFCSEEGKCVNCLIDSDCLYGFMCKASTYTCGFCPSDKDCPGNKFCSRLTGHCYQCQTSADCSLSQYCEFGTFQCKLKECLSNADCSNPLLPRCDPTFFNCTTCQLDTDCTGIYLYCNSTGNCDLLPDVVSCTVSSTCPAHRPVCRNLNCTYCFNDFECPTGIGTCQSLTGLCVNCTNSTNCTAPDVCRQSSFDCGPCLANQDCPYNAPFCNGGRCYECLEDRDCDSLEYCSILNYTCQTKLCQNSSECSLIYPLCDGTFYNCTLCKYDYNCPVLYPFCLTNGSCAECRTNSDCPFSRPICGLDNFCRSCLSDTECPKICNATGYCVECNSSTNCTGNNEICLAPLSQCGVCRNDGDCISPAKYCTSMYGCVECRGQIDCQSLEYCHPSARICLNRTCISSTDCDRFNPVCDEWFYFCKSCISNTNCPSAFPVCSSNGSCVECVNHTDCRMNPINKYCYNNTCQPCLEDSACSPKVCNIFDGVCYNPQCNISSDCKSISSSRCFGKLCFPCKNNSDCSHMLDYQICLEGFCSEPICNTTTAARKRGSACGGCLIDYDCYQFYNETICSDGVCVNCTSDTNCTSIYPICNLLNKYCRPCQSHAECFVKNTSKPYCHPNGKCVGCLENSHCTLVTNSYCSIINDYTCTSCSNDVDCNHFSTILSKANCINRTCINCPQKCLQCLNFKNCTVCENPYSPIQGECGFYCLPGWNLLPNNTCGEICGDGIRRAKDPYCDDGNKDDGDGCSSSCKTEEGWYCTGGGMYSKDFCRIYPVFIVSQSLKEPSIFYLDFNQNMTFPSNISSRIRVIIQGYDNSQYEINFYQISLSRIQMNITAKTRIFKPIIYFNFTQTTSSFIGANRLSMNKIIYEYSARTIPYIQQSDLNSAMDLSSGFKGVTSATLFLTAPSFISSANPALLYAFINAMQLFYYLLYINTDYPENVKEFLKIFSISTFSFLPNPLEIISPDITEETLPAPDRFLMLDKSGYFLAEEGSSILIWLIVTFIYILSEIIHRNLRSLPYLIQKASLSIIESFKWSGLIGTLEASYLNLTIAALLQLRVMTFTNYYYAISSVIAVLIIIANLVVLPLAIRIVEKFKNRPKYLRAKFGILTSDLHNNNRISLHFKTIMIGRRFLTGIIYVFGQDFPSLQCSSLATVNIIAMTVIWKLKPFVEKKNLVLNFLNEFFFLAIHLCVLIIVEDNLNVMFNDEQRASIGWTIIAFCCAQLVTTFVVVSIEQFEIIREILKKFKKVFKKENRKVTINTTRTSENTTSSFEKTTLILDKSIIKSDKLDMTQSLPQYQTARSRFSKRNIFKKV